VLGWEPSINLEVGLEVISGSKVSSEKLFASPKPKSPCANLPRANVLGVGVHALDLKRAASLVLEAVGARHKGYVCVTGVHGVTHARRDPEFLRALESAMLVVPDGMPTVWVGRWQGHRQMRRVFGPDLFLEICRRSVFAGHTHFFYGGNPGVAEQLEYNVRQWFPGIRTLGTFTPPFRNLSISERTQLQQLFAKVSPDIVWVGLSTPRQEQFMAEYLPYLDCRVMIGVGAAFDLHTGRLKDAPTWVKQGGLQWLHRLCQEPSRLWKRYLINNSAFLINILLQLSGIKRYHLTHSEADSSMVAGPDPSNI
jgi:N-acetylglucosaminyldiphosphoundecaprenol N-acetyl-beta-D-mannosaminyltransferase